MAPAAQHAVVQDRELQQVGQHQTDPVTGGDTACGEQRGHPAGERVEFGVGKRVVAEFDGDAVAVCCGGTAEEVGEVHLRPLV